MPRSRVAFALVAVVFAFVGVSRSEQDDKEMALVAFPGASPVVLPRPDSRIGHRLPPVTRQPPPAQAASNENLAMGNPSGAGSDPANFLMLKEQYVLSYNDTKHIPNWVSWHLNAGWIGSEARENDFRPDDTLPQGFVPVNPSDYEDTGFDKGHMCDSKDRTNTADNNSATFYMTNMVPQSKRNNEQTWKGLEDESRKLAQGSGQPELYIVAGPWGAGGTSVDGTFTSLPMKRRGQVVGTITVPKCVWKVVLVAPHGTVSPSQVTASAQMIAVIMPNDQSPDTDWSDYQVSVDQVEQMTHYHFFSDVDPNVAGPLKANNASAKPTQCGS